MPRIRVLIIEDEPALYQMLQTSLREAGYETNVVTDGVGAVEQVGLWKPDLVLLDLGLPGLGGLEACRLIRAWSQVPIIVISVEYDERTKVAALDNGADDYVTKPFGMDELLARLRVAVRRITLGGSPTASVLRFDDLTLDLPNRQVTLRKQELRLTRREYNLLVALARQAGRVLTFEQLMREVWEGDPEADVRSLRVHMGTLRRKMGEDPTNPRFIFTETGIGYRFRPFPEDQPSPQGDVS